MIKAINFVKGMRASVSYITLPTSQGTSMTTLVEYSEAQTKKCKYVPNKIDVKGQIISKAIFLVLI